MECAAALGPSFAPIVTITSKVWAIALLVGPWIWRHSWTPTFERSWSGRHTADQYSCGNLHDSVAPVSIISIGLVWENWPLRCNPYWNNHPRIIRACKKVKAVFKPDYTCNTCPIIVQNTVLVYLGRLDLTPLRWERLRKLPTFVPSGDLSPISLVEGGW